MHRHELCVQKHCSKYKKEILKRKKITYLIFYFYNRGKMAYSRFPREIWMLILDGMESIQDISNLFVAYPEMTELISLFTSKRNNLYVALVFPHVLPWLTKKEVLQCRKVCVRWSHGVDDFLQNHPSKRAYNPEAEPQPWIPIPKTPSPHYPLLWPYSNRVTNELETGAGVLLNSCGKVGRFLHFTTSLRNYPQERNPFLGRALNISDYQWQNFESGRGVWTSQLSNYWHRVINILQRHGAHIWYLDINRTDVLHDEFSHRSYQPRDIIFPKQTKLEFTKLVLDSLNYLPSLKKLQLKRKRRSPNSEENTEFHFVRDVPLMPVLPHLETLEVISCDLPEYLVGILVMTYSSQLKKLSINGRFWRKQYSNIFPSLTEFWLMEEGLYSEDNIKNIILSLEAPQLYSLHLSFRDHKFVVEDKIIPWLKRFPRLESLALDYLGICQDFVKTCKKVRRRRSPSEQLDSLKHLWINHYAGENDSIFDFLGCFPSLESLAIHPKLRYSGCFKYDNMYKPGLWNRLGRVKKITIMESRLFEGRYPWDMPIHYSRARYEYLEGGNAELD